MNAIERYGNPDLIFKLTAAEVFAENAESNVQLWGTAAVISQPLRLWCCMIMLTCELKVEEVAETYLTTFCRYEKQITHPYTLHFLHLDRLSLRHGLGSLQMFAAELLT